MKTGPATIRRLAAAALALAGLLLWAAAPGAAEQEQRSGIAALSDITGAIGPATVKQIGEAIETAEAERANILILRINTPGGLVDSTRDIISLITTADIPVIGYVAPAGAHAASAGTYIMYATGLAAMAPGSNLGAATPVQMGGGGLPGLGEDDKTPDQKDADGGNAPAGDDKAPSGGTAMEHKIVNDAVALIRGLAELHGRNADWAEEAVREGASLTASEAVQRNVVELLAGNVGELLEKADGREVVTGAGKVTLETKGLIVRTIEPGFLTKLLSLISHPNVAFVLMMIGIYGLIFEFSNPGSFGPGIIGAICLVLGFYALNQLPLDYAGLALIALGVGLMVAEAVTPTFGALGLGGLVAFVIGATMLVDSDAPEFQLSWSVIAITTIATGLLLILLLGYVWREQRRHVTTGREGMTGVKARVVEWREGEGYVLAQSERWHARGPRDLKPGDEIAVTGLDGLTLILGEPQG
ncbi:membrane-bound serine protease (ClpP class) [Parvibaculum indicum]|uniref:NfeD family protein n=1 Tax=Parvibaculum indicum TaxID=562969 RepID=UPI0031B57AF5|nr:membrane-bound serine protease (ClpP class) [Parvibaculum indicum]